MEGTFLSLKSLKVVVLSFKDNILGVVDGQEEGQSLDDSEFCAGPNGNLNKACPGYSKINSFRIVP